MTLHCATTNWELHSTLLYFRRFVTPHTGEALATLLKSVMFEWDLNEKIFAVTTYNANDTVWRISIFNDRNATREVYHIRSVAHVINLALNKYLKIVRNDLSNMQNLINSIRCPVKRRDLFDLMKKKAGVNNSILPQLDLETQLSLGFKTLETTYKSRAVLSAAAYKILSVAKVFRLRPSLFSFSITEVTTICIDLSSGVKTNLRPDFH